MQQKKHSWDFLLCNLTLNMTPCVLNSSSAHFQFLFEINISSWKFNIFSTKSTSLIIHLERKQIVNFIYFSGISSEWRQTSIQVHLLSLIDFAAYLQVMLWMNNATKYQSDNWQDLLKIFGFWITWILGLIALSRKWNYNRLDTWQTSCKGLLTSAKCWHTTTHLGLFAKLPENTWGCNVQGFEEILA